MEALTTAGAASALGMTAVMARPKAQKTAALTASETTKAGRVFEGTSTS